ncbi:hypothetical protein ACKBOX_004560, partial [Vibrio parahaemolyticus]
SKRSKVDKILDLAIREAEEQFGASRHSRKILPVKFTAGSPVADTSNPDSIEVFINIRCKTENYRAYYQLSHEAVHTLSPVSYEVVSWLEEGVATKFSHEFLARHCGINWDESGDDKYNLAWKKVTELLEFDPKAIQKIMDAFGCLSGIEPQEMCKLLPNVPERLIVELCMPFNPKA